MNRIKKQYIWTAVLVLYAAFVFSNSMKPASLSSKDSGFVLRLVQQILAPAGGLAGLVTEHLVRKMGHFTEYAVFGILLTVCVRSWKATAWQGAAIRLAAGFLVPFCDETIQLFVEGRSGQLSDVWLDAAGVFFGVLVWTAAAWLGAQRKKNRRLTR